MPDNILDIQLLSEHEMAKALGIKYSMVRKMRIEDGLPFVRVGKRIFYRPQAVQKWLGQQETDNKSCLNEVRRIS